MVAHLSDYFFPLFYQGRASAIRFVFRKHELCSLAPNAELVDCFSNGDFALGFVRQFLDLFVLLEHLCNGVKQVAKCQVVEGHFFWHLEHRN